MIFSDFECPACAAGRRLLEHVERQNHGPLRICYKHFPLRQHEHARLAARAAVAAQRQGRFWPYHDLLFANQGGLERSDLLEYAAQLKLDHEHFVRDSDSERSAERVEHDANEGMSLRINATPTFFLNGRPMVGAYSLAAFVDWIDEERALVRADNARTAARPARAR